MARETRHLKISNIPSGVTEDKLLQYFQSFGGVQKVASLRPQPGSEGPSEDAQKDAIVSFVDIRSATRVVASSHKLEDSELKAEYFTEDTSEGAQQSSTNCGTFGGKQPISGSGSHGLIIDVKT